MLRTLFSDVQKSAKAWEQLADAAVVGQRLDTVVNVFHTSTDWPKEKVRFWALEMPIEGKALPSEAISSSGNWFGVEARFDCGIASISKIAIPILMKCNQQGEGIIQVGETMLRWAQDGDLTEVVHELGGQLKRKFAGLEIIKGDWPELRR